METAADIAQRLMAIESTTGSEGRVMDAMADLLDAHRWDVIRIPVSPGRDCVLARSGSDPDLTLSTHLDTVPP
jgi:acetylornithine deacetylase/succinyl-diaminopimelate desuccinylase-like protein